MGAIKGIILKFGPADNTQLYSCDTRCHYIIQTTEHLLSCYAWRCACLVSSPSFLSTSTWFTGYCTFPAFFCSDTDLLTPATYHLPSLRTKQCILIRLMSEISYFLCTMLCRRFHSRTPTIENTSICALKNNTEYQ